MTGVDSPSESAQVDQLFTEWDKPTSPGCALVIMRDGHIIYERGCGMADLDHNVKITPTTVFHVASMSKQFTAASVLMLAQEGKLSLDDEAINMCQSSQILGYRSHSAIQRSDRDLLSRMAQGN
jgi:CubicO group peptidase (beta-lactamase class C family)